MSYYSKALSCAVLCAAVAAALPALAQTPAAKTPKVSTLGGSKSANSKVLTRDELRSCLQRQDGMQRALAGMQTQRSALDAERVEIERENEAVKAERSSIDALQAQAAALRERVGAHGKRIEDFNQRVQQIKDSGKKPSKEQVDALETERKDIDVAAKALKADGEAFQPGYEEAIKRFNDRLVANDQRATDWNTRNNKLLDEAQVAEGERSGWTAGCAGRRFREDDEIAIRAGK